MIQSATANPLFLVAVFLATIICALCDTLAQRLAHEARTPGATFANFMRLRSGMTQAEVHNALGPADPNIVVSGSLIKNWRSDSATISLYFDPCTGILWSGRCSSWAGTDIPLRTVGVLDNLLRRLGKVGAIRNTSRVKSPP